MTSSTENGKEGNNADAPSRLVLEEEIDCASIMSDKIAALSMAAASKDTSHGIGSERRTEKGYFKHPIYCSTHGTCYIAVSDPSINESETSYLLVGTPKVEDIVFCLPKLSLSSSEFFHFVLSLPPNKDCEGLSLDSPLILQGIEVKDFEHLAAFLYHE